MPCDYILFAQAFISIVVKKKREKLSARCIVCPDILATVYDLFCLFQVSVRTKTCTEKNTEKSS